jgi:hypothetical protein
MYDYRPAYDDYILTIYYEGKKYRLRLKLYHSNWQYSYWHLFAHNRVLDLKFNESKNQLSEELLAGQSSSPKDFLHLLEKEFNTIRR